MLFFSDFLSEIISTNIKSEEENNEEENHKYGIGYSTKDVCFSSLVDGQILNIIQLMFFFLWHSIILIKFYSNQAQ